MRCEYKASITTSWFRGDMFQATDCNSRGTASKPWGIPRRYELKLTRSRICATRNYTSRLGGCVSRCSIRTNTCLRANEVIGFRLIPPGKRPRAPARTRESQRRWRLRVVTWRVGKRIRGWILPKEHYCTNSFAVACSGHSVHLAMPARVRRVAGTRDRRTSCLEVKCDVHVTNGVARTCKYMRRKASSQP